MKKFVLSLTGAIVAASCTLPGALAASAEEEFSELSELFPTDTDPKSEFMVSVWTTSDGLPANEIWELMETPDGYLWLGTYQGVARFDGMRFQTFFSTPTGLRYGARVGPLETDSRGRLWVAPDQTGLIYHDKGSFTEVLTNGTLLQARTVSLCSDGTNGMMWVDANGGLGRVSIDKPNQAERIKGNASGGSRWMRDSKGQLWLANLRSLKIYRQGKFRDVAVPGTAPFVATPRKAGGIWIAREAKLRYVTEDGQGREVEVFPWKGQSRVNCLMEDSRERLWIGTVGQGLYCYSAGQFKQVMPTASSISCLLEDSDNNIWAGARGGGLIRLRERQFYMHDMHSGLENEFVRSISQDKSGKVWLLTAEGGLGWWQNNVWHRMGHSEGWGGFDSFCVLATSDGSVWVSTARKGIWRGVDGHFTKQELGPATPREPIVDFLEDRRNRLWMVTDNTGVYCLEGGRLAGYTTRDGLPSKYIRRMVEDDTGIVWVGDWEGAIARLHEQRWEVVRPPSGHKDAVRSMVASSEALWIGTSAGGLLRLKDGKTTRVSVEHGLPDACIQQLLLDGKGSLWGSTPHKLFRISLDQLNAVMDGREQQVEVITYGRSDGLPDVSFAAWSDPRCWRTADGELWFATANGAIHCQPGNLQQGKPPQVILEKTLLDGKLVNAEALKRLRLDSGRLEFRFTAPCLTAPERVRFRYQLTGVDSDWVDAGTARVAAYPTIPTGDHVFRVMASSPEGIWNLKPASVTLAVHPYFWQTNWFLAAIAAVGAGGGVWVVRRATVRKLSYRLERLREQRAVDQERARIAQDIHDELGANLTSIGLLADMGARHKTNPAAVERELAQISQAARESVAAMDAIVWALNPRNDSLDHFANYISQFTREFFRPTQLRTRLELPADLPTQPLSTDTRHQLFLLVKESFNNIVRHAHATEMYLGIACENGHLQLTIADNGKGLSQKTKGEGHDGLANLRERIERLGGSLKIKSESGQGTRLEFVLPLAGAQQR